MPSISTPFRFVLQAAPVAPASYVAAFGGGYPKYTTLSNGTDTQHASRMKMRSLDALTSLKVSYVNYIQAGETPAQTLQNITIESSIEYPAGTFTRVQFTGSNTRVINAGSAAVSDSVTIAIPANTDFWVRTHVSVASGYFVLPYYTKLDYTEGVVSQAAITSAGHNFVMSGSIANSQNPCYGPAAVIGSANSSKHSVLWLGDSISAGMGDNIIGNYGYEHTGGLAARAFGNSFPLLRGYWIGAKMSDWSIPSNRPGFADLFPYATRFIDQLGINEMHDANAESLYITIWDQLMALGIKGYKTTITPWSASSDNWSTLTQTPAGVNAKRVQVNDWIRDGAPMNGTTRVKVATGNNDGTTIRAGHANHPLLGYIELADTVESSRNSGLWKTGHTSDGLHPNGTGFPVLAAAIDTALFNR